MTEIDQELVDLYAADRPGMPRHVIAAFVVAGVEPPTSDLRGYSSDQAAIIGAYYAKHDPYGARAEVAG
jgi:hypothetical protein